MFSQVKLSFKRRLILLFSHNYCKALTFTFFQLDINLETDEEAGEQFIEAFQEFFKIFDDYGIIEKSEFKNITAACKNITNMKMNNEKENKVIENTIATI